MFYGRSTLNNTNGSSRNNKMKAETRRQVFLKRTGIILAADLAVCLIQSFFLLSPAHGPVGILHRLGAPFSAPFYLYGPRIAWALLGCLAIVGVCAARGRWFPLGYTVSVIFSLLHNLGLFFGIALANIGE